MSKTKLVYFEKKDVLHLAISDEPEGGSIELSPNITAELNDKGELIGIEILNASAFIRESILESVQAEMLKLVSIPPSKPRAQFGSAKGLITISDDLDAPVEDFKEYMR